jgi:hypothetical protein
MPLSGLMSHRKRMTFMGNASGVSGGDRSSRHDLLPAGVRGLLLVRRARGAGAEGTHSEDTSTRWRCLVSTAFLRWRHRVWLSTPTTMTADFESAETRYEAEQEHARYDDPQWSFGPPPQRGLMLSAESQWPQSEDGQQVGGHVPEE